MSTIIKASNGGEILVDETDAALVSQWKWRVSPQGYASRTGYKNGRFIKILMHRLIMEPIPEGLEVDHINRNRLDNRRENLRVVTHAVNQRNSGMASNNTSGYRGVCWDKSKRKWKAATKHDGRHVMIGRFATAEDAHKAYVEYMSKLPGYIQH